MVQMLSDGDKSRLHHTHSLPPAFRDPSSDSDQSQPQSIQIQRLRTENAQEKMIYPKDFLVHLQGFPSSLVPFLSGIASSPPSPFHVRLLHLSTTEPMS